MFPCFFCKWFRSACTSAATLPELFPSLADLPEANTVAIELGWQGLSPLSPVEANYLLELRNGQFEGKARFKVATAAATRDIVVPHDLVRAFLAAATRVKLVEKEYQPRIAHTDDYPSVAVAVGTRQGELTITTRSQPQKSASGKYWDATPWAIRYSESTFVVTADDLDQHLGPIMGSPAIRTRSPANWRSKQDLRAAATVLRSTVIRSGCQWGGSQPTGCRENCRRGEHVHLDAARLPSACLIGFRCPAQERTCRAPQKPPLPMR